MCVKQNSLNNAAYFPFASKAVNESYVDNGSTGADSIEGTIRLQQELQLLFSCAGFLLRKWNSSEAAVLEQIPSELRDLRPTQEISVADMYTRTLGVEWNANTDYFRLTIGAMPQLHVLTKRNLVSDAAKTFDILRWFSPSIILIKILLQQTWEMKIGWDDLFLTRYAQYESIGDPCLRCYQPNTFSAATTPRAHRWFQFRYTALATHQKQPMQVLFI